MAESDRKSPLWLRALGSLMLPWVIAIVAVAALGGVAVVALGLMPGKPLDWKQVETATMQILGQEELMFLVTDRVVTRVDVVAKEGSMLLGWHESVLVGTVEFLCGVDLSALDPQDISHEADVLIVRVPEPEILNVSVDLETRTLFDKKSGLIAVKEYLQKRDVRAELQQRLETRAREFAVQEGLVPGRQSLLDRLNKVAAPLVAAHVGVTVEFR